MSERERQGELTTYLREQGITHFSGREVVTLRRLGKIAEVPPESWWPRIIPALRIAERIRDELGHSLLIGNGYRPPALNRAAKGGRRSRHLTFRALDLDLPNAHKSRDAQEALYQAAASAYLDVGEATKMGLGIYRPHRGPRVHIDCGDRQRCWGGPKTMFRWRTKEWVHALLEEMR